MKKISLLLLMAVSSLSFAQTHFGVKAGYINSSLKWKSSPDTFWEDFSDFDSKSYFYVGGFAEYFLTHKFALQGELIYTELGGKTAVDLYDFIGNEIIQGGTMELKYKYSQIQVPISAKYYIIDQFSVLGGFNLGFNVDSKIKSDFMINGNSSNKLENVKTINVFPFIGTEFHFNKNIFADARYNFGVSNINKEGIDTRVSFFQIGLGYLFK